jgi:hypothetical protein
MLLETVALLPVLLLLLIGGIEFGKIAVTYFTLQKALRGAARMAGVLRGANFCDPVDPQIAAVKDFIVFGSQGDTGNPLVAGLAADQIVITPERYDSDSGAIIDCGCGGANGCLAADGGRPPDFVRVSIAGGYPFQPRIPFRVLETVLLRPHVRIPFGGQ